MTFEEKTKEYRDQITSLKEIEERKYFSGNEGQAILSKAKRS